MSILQGTGSFQSSKKLKIVIITKLENEGMGEGGGGGDVEKQMLCPKRFLLKKIQNKKKIPKKTPQNNLPTYQAYFLTISGNNKFIFLGQRDGLKGLNVRLP